MESMHIHILGICGTFMGGVAALAREAGHKVTGCDAGVYPPMSDQLRLLGIDLIEGFGVMEWLQTKRPHRHVRGRLLRRVRNADSPKKSPRSFAIPDTNIPAANFQCRRRALFPKPIHHKMVIPRLRRGPKHWLLSLVESDCGSPQIF